MKRRTFLWQSGAGFAAAASGALAQQAPARHAPASADAARPIAAAKIVHPGILQTRADLEFMKARILAGDEPWKSAWDRWIAEPNSSLDFKPKPYTHIIRGAYGAGQKGGAELSASAAAVNIHVLQWFVTGNEAHARKAIEILDAWSGTLADFFENDAMLLSGWTGGEFCNAAEILRATYPKWSAESQHQFKKMLLTVFVPLLRMYYPEANGNWDGAIMFTLLSIGVYCEDRALIDSVYHHYRVGPVNAGITRYIYPSGQCEETTRDQGHVQLGLGYFARTALVAWNQGVDLFSEAGDRLALGYEYTARLLLGEPVPVYGVVQRPTGNFSDVYEYVLQHYRYRKHIDMPFTARAAEKARAHAHSVVTVFRGDPPGPSPKLQPPPAPSKIATAAGAQSMPTSPAPSNAITVAAGDSIQDALDKLKSTGGVISLGAGLHTLPSSLRLPSNVTITGTGLDCILFLDSQNKSGAEAAIVNAEPDLHNVVLRDFLIEGGLAPKASTDPNSDVQRRRPMHGPIRAGIVLLADDAKSMRNLRFEHLTVRNCTYSAVEVFGGDRVEFVNCDFSASGGMVPPGIGKNHNLKLNRVSSVTISGSRFADSMCGCGIFLSFGSQATIRDCELSRNELDGLRIAQSRDVAIESCLIEGNTGAAINRQTWMDPNQNIAARNNTVRNNAIAD